MDLLLPQGLRLCSTGWNLWQRGASDVALWYSVPTLSTLVQDVNTRKLLYTAVSTCYMLKALTTEEASNILRIGLGKTSKTCTCLDAIVIFKLILDKAERDGFIARADKHRFDNIVSCN